VRTLLTGKIKTIIVKHEKLPLRAKKKGLKKITFQDLKLGE